MKSGDYVYVSWKHNPEQFSGIAKVARFLDYNDFIIVSRVGVLNEEAYSHDEVRFATPAEIIEAKLLGL